MKIEIERDVLQQALEALNLGIMKMNALGCAIECMPLHYANKALREAMVAANSPEFGRIKTEDQPPFDNKRREAMAVYVPPFRFGHGYVYDSQNEMVADDHQVESAVASRVRGWGRLGYMPNGEELQDEIGQMIADALNAYYAAQTKPVVEPVAWTWDTPAYHFGKGVVSAHFQFNKPEFEGGMMNLRPLYASHPPPP